jgi:hypothetical protein
MRVLWSKKDPKAETLRAAKSTQLTIGPYMSAYGGWAVSFCARCNRRATPLPACNNACQPATTDQRRQGAQNASRHDAGGAAARDRQREPGRPLAGRHGALARSPCGSPRAALHDQVRRSPRARSLWCSLSLKLPARVRSGEPSAFEPSANHAELRRMVRGFAASCRVCARTRLPAVDARSRAERDLCRCGCVGAGGRPTGRFVQPGGEIQPPIVPQARRIRS